VVVICNSRKFM